MKVKLANSNQWIKPTEEWQKIRDRKLIQKFQPDRNFYIEVKEVK